MSFQRRGIGEFATAFGSLASYVKGDIEIINDDVKSYAFSNVFDVAARAGDGRQQREQRDEEAPGSAVAGRPGHGPPVRGRRGKEKR